MQIMGRGGRAAQHAGESHPVDVALVLNRACELLLCQLAQHVAAPARACPGITVTQPHARARTTTPRIESEAEPESQSGS